VSTFDALVVDDLIQDGRLRGADGLLTSAA